MILKSKKQNTVGFEIELIGVDWGSIFAGLKLGLQHVRMMYQRTGAGKEDYVDENVRSRR